AVMLMLSSSPNSGVVLTPDLVASARSRDGTRFGAALAVGQLNDGSFPDLAVGSPETGTDPAGSGAVYVFADRASGLEGKQELRPSDAAGGMRFGAALAVGDFDASRTRQLAVGAPYRTYKHRSPTAKEAGAVYMFKPTATATISFTERPPAVLEATPVAGNHLGGVLLAWHTTSCIDFAQPS